MLNEEELKPLLMDADVINHGSFMLFCYIKLYINNCIFFLMVLYFIASILLTIINLKYILIVEH